VEPAAKLLDRSGFVEFGGFIGFAVRSARFVDFVGFGRRLVACGVWHVGRAQSGVRGPGSEGRGAARGAREERVHPLPRRALPCIL